jgi:hypothetical protein
MIAFFSLASAASLEKVVGASPDNIDFGKHYLGTQTLGVPVTITNQTGVARKFAIAPDLPDFIVVADGCRDEVWAGASCKATVSFAPGVVGERTGKLRIRYAPGGEGGGGSVGLNGIGVLPALTVSPRGLDFKAQDGAAGGAPQIVVLANTGSTNLTVSNLAVSGDFAVESLPLPRVLPPASSLAVSVRFIPRRTGPSTGSISILSDFEVNPLQVALTGSTPGPCGNPGVDSALADISIAFALAVGYWLAMVTVRWHRVALTTRAQSRGEIESVKVELDGWQAGLDKPDPASAERFAGLKALLERARQELDGSLDRSRRLLDFLFWSRGHELTAWCYAHEVQRQMIPLLPLPTVRARLEVAEQTLRRTGDASYTALADDAHMELVKAETPATEPRLRALLGQALAASYDLDDSSFADLVSWQNKTAWLVGCGLLLIVALTAAFPRHGILFLVGAVGGLLGRLSRSLNRTSTPTDYGASWTTLFLSPVAGAIGGWAGVLVANLAVTLNVLGSSFKVEWLRPTEPMTLAIALVFGFSERFFDGVLDKLNDKALASQPAATRAPKPAPQATPYPPPPPGQPSP